MIPIAWRSFLFSFEGRIGRLPFWLFLLAGIPLGLINGLVEALLEQAPRTGTLFYLAVVLMVVWACVEVAELWAALAITSKRLHDRDRSGWFLFVIFIPFIGFFWLSYELGFARGSDRANRFGPAPGTAGLSRAAT